MIRTKKKVFVIRTYQFEASTFRKGSAAPADQVLSGGTLPVKGYLYTNTNERSDFTFMVPLDWVRGTDFQFMIKCAVPSGQTFNVADKINLDMRIRVDVGDGSTSLIDDTKVRIFDVDTPSVSAPYYNVVQNNQIVADGNTEGKSYMSNIFINVGDLAGQLDCEPGGVIYGNIGLKSILAGNVPSLFIYQMHINYYGL